jgi:signal transduction histidine kinase
MEAGEVNPPTRIEQLILTAEQRAQNVRLACQVIPENDLQLQIVNPVSRPIWSDLAPDSLPCTPSLLPPVAGEYSAPGAYGLAIDLGTTQISLSLWDLKGGRRLHSRMGLNPQFPYGADVVTRVMAAVESPQDARRLARLPLEAVADAVQELCRQKGLRPEDVIQVAIVGNTAMLALLTGADSGQLLQPQNWTRPMEFRVNQPETWVNILGIHPLATVEIISPLAGFVGSDLLAGVVATRLTEQPGSLFIDFGTNTEMALWDGLTLWVTSAAGGPAFEGCGMQCGMPAEPGAIYRCGGSSGSGEFEFQVLGGGEARGFCGSGLVDLIACLRDRGELTRTGGFADPRHKDGGLVLQAAPIICLSKKDVDTFQRAKAAVGAGIAALLARARIDAAELSRLCVCGIFGRNLDIGNAQRIGLLPQTPSGRVELCGNTALAGCERLLLSPARMELLAALRDRASIVNLSQISDFNNLFLESLYLDPLPAQPRRTAGTPTTPKGETAMKGHRSSETQVFEAFLKSAQYLVRLQTQQDLWEHLGTFILTHFPADWLACVERDSGDRLSLSYCTMPEDAAQVILTDEIRTLIADVMESGFLASRVLLTPAPSMTAFLPIVENYQTSRVMLIGHHDAEPLARELLNIYLALAGLAGATSERKRAEEEVRRLNAELERRVTDRTVQLQITNADLLKEIIERERVEDALRASESLYRGLFEHMAEGLAYCKMIFENGEGTDLVYLAVNPAFETLTGLKEVTGKRITEVIPGIREADPDLFVIYSRVALTGVPEKLEMFIEALGMWFSISVYSPGKGFIVVIFDVITERKRAEEALIRTEKLAVTGRLAATMAHEINNPLAAMTNIVYLLGQSLTEGANREYVDILEKQLRTISRITNQTLKFHRQLGRPAQFDLAELIGELVDFYQAKATEHGVTLVKRWDGEAWIMGFSGEIRQVISNLLLNAIEATPENGRVTLHLYESVDWHNGNRRGYRVSVADTGVGIDAQHRSSIFEPFFTTKGENGTGLGLWVSTGIVNRAGGHMRVRSTQRPGRSGTCFSIFFPAEMPVTEIPERRRYESPRPQIGSDDASKRPA